jgi:hypothetical protein
MQVLQSVREENSENLPAGCRGEILKGFLFKKVSFCKIIKFLIVKSTFFHCKFIVQLAKFCPGLKKINKTKFKTHFKNFLTFLKEFLWSSDEDSNVAQC